jgi:hypothetical protein
MRFQLRGGRKRILAPDGSAIVPTSKPQSDGTLVKALARAWRWQRMLDQGAYASVSEIGDAENISKSYVSRILRLALLAPGIEARHLRMIHVHHDVEREVGVHAKLYANDGTLIGPNGMGASVATA